MHCQDMNCVLLLIDFYCAICTALCIATRQQIRFRSAPSLRGTRQLKKRRISGVGTLAKLMVLAASQVPSLPISLQI